MAVSSRIRHVAPPDHCPSRLLMGVEGTLWTTQASSL